MADHPILTEMRRIKIGEPIRPDVLSRWIRRLSADFDALQAQVEALEEERTAPTPTRRPPQRVA